MTWTNSAYEVIETINDEYFFAGSAWNTQIAKRFVLKTKRFGRLIEASYYLHLDKGKPFNIAFEPSTSFGCSVGCLFCASGTLSPIKALTVAEIVEQVNTLIAIYRRDFPDYRIREDVFYSGIGEPTLMTNVLIEASARLLEQNPDLQFKMSTMGALPSALLRWADSELPLRSLQVGIPHWNEDKIKYLYSKCSKYNLHDVLQHVQLFMDKRPDTAIKINYIVMENYNNSLEDLKRTVEKVISILGRNIELKISCLNPTEFAEQNQLIAVKQQTLETLAGGVQSFGLKKVYTFGPMSKDKLGCGQLAGNYKLFS
ncbi:radical SAM protein [Legionella sp. 16cNR16C]|uniref:radical SAM protein n=1 Tax=Legionella sp. 16cNR16C TaxID=2905656 RepID=UPI001E479405|nr:radical SAM protein [Legionella sp. 16cNR16C]MCE3046310.1 radical SAM protein [Legionella sp. 16cNR16C]